MADDVESVCRIDCAAKLNLFLEVLAKRDDGFHEIETIMVAVNRYDSLYFSSDVSERIQVSCQWASGMEAGRAGSGVVTASGGGDLPQDADNIVWRAVELLRRQAGVTSGARVRLVKRIPAMAGLGGASSNAAAALLAANHVWRLGWNRLRLAELAAELGSDVPFFLSNATRGSSLAIARGRGERIETLAGTGIMHIVVIRPPTGLATPAVYGRCRPADPPREARPLAMALAAGRLDQVGRLLFNRLEPAAEQLSPWIAVAQTAFARADCLGHAMSGSGTSYFGLCRHERHARRLAATLEAKGMGYVFHAATTSAACRPMGTTA